MTGPEAPAASRLRSALSSGIALVGASTLIAGVIGYAITWLVPRQIGFALYADFASFWAFVFLVVATLSGIQQEVTRATRPREGGHSNVQVWTFAAIVSVSVAVVIVATAALWVEAVFPRDGWPIVWPLAVGTASYVFIAVVTGTLYGLQRWRRLFAIVVCEAFLRIGSVAITAAFTSDVTALAWAVVIPFPFTAALLILASRKALFSSASVDVTLPGLSWNVARTVLASASMGLIISGFPLLLTVASSTDPRELLALVILTSTLVRAPLIVTSMALQSYFIVLFRSRADRFWATFLALQATVIGLGAVLAALGLLVGPPVFGLLFPGEPEPEGWFVAGLVASSALVGSLCISAPAVLSRSAHSVFTAGWVAAAVATVLVLLVPLDLASRTVLALSVGPVAGLAIHLAYLIRTRTVVRASAA